MPGSILGNSVLRLEDPDLLTGRATFVDDLAIDGLLHLAFVRSTVAHAIVEGIELEDARAMPGVIAVFTAADLAIPRHHAFIPLNDACARPPLAEDRVRFVGEAVAVVVAETKAEATDAAEAVVVDYRPLVAVVDAEDALAPGAPLQFESLGTNLAAGTRHTEDVDPLAGAHVVVRGRFVNQRIAVAPMEGNAIAVVTGPDQQDHDVTAYVSTQMPHAFHRMATTLFGLDPSALRVVTPNVGGAFGSKAGLMSEHSVAIGVARKLGRNVKWVESRSENMTAMPHGRAQIQYVEMGFTADGHIVGLRCRMVGDAGAYGGFGGGLALGPTRMMAQGVYRIPTISYSAAVAVTNTTPVGAFRGAGRPEATAFLERLMDMAADELDLDPVEIRRRNFLRPDEFPYKTLMGTTYDCGDYDAALTEVLRVADYAELRADQAARRGRGDTVQLGIGVSAYVEITGGGASSEYASVEVDETGGATIKVGTSAHGQGHATSFAMLVSDQLGIPIERIRFVQSDTAMVPRGGGTGGSRSLQLGGSAVHQAAAAVLERGRDLAARLLEASPDDVVVFDGGLVGVSGVPSSGLTWAELARAARDEGEELEVSLDFTQKGATFPFGAHVAVVEVDLETGLVRPMRHIAVDDCGRIINPLIVVGQQHGGVAQGIAQALWEQFVYDPDGNPQTSTLAEYAMPSAAEFPLFEVSNTETPTYLNPLGAKGIGESGTIGAMPAVQNAVIDALSHLGVRHIDMPCTPERVWEAIGAATFATPPSTWREPPAVFDALPTRTVGRSPAPANIDI